MNEVNQPQVVIVEKKKRSKGFILFASILASLFGLAAVGGVYAASQTITSQVVAGGGTAVSGCSTPVALSYTYDGTDGDITTMTISDIPADCQGGALNYDIRDGESSVLDSGTATLDLDSSTDVTLTPDAVTPAALAQVNLVIIADEQVGEP